MILYGSLTSPFVRRIRLLLEGIDYELKAVNVYDDAVSQDFSLTSPIKKLPVLKDNDTVIFDSHNIHAYLCKKYKLPELSTEQLNQLSVIDAITDSLVILFIGKRSDLPVDTDHELFKLQLNRIPSCLEWLDQQAKNKAFDEWNYSTMSLISLLDWAEFRGLCNFDKYTELLAVRDKCQNQKILVETYPQTP